MCPPQKFDKAQPTFENCFVTPNQISAYQRLNFPLINNICLVFFTLEMQEDLYRPKYTTRFVV